MWAFAADKSSRLYMLASIILYFLVLINILRLMKKHDDLEILNVIAQTIYDKKGVNILALDVREISSLTDFFIIAEGNVDKHIQAISGAIVQNLKDIGVRPAHVEGQQSGDWIVLDYWCIVIHLFIPGLREIYQLERMWEDSTIVDLNIKKPESLSM